MLDHWGRVMFDGAQTDYQGNLLGGLNSGRVESRSFVLSLM